MSAEPGPAGATRGPPAAGKWVLVVADQPVMRDILERFLQGAGYFVSTAAETGEGLARAQSLPVDLVVLDLDMAGGFPLAAKLKNEPATARRPVLFISARHKPHDLGAIAPAGADGFLAVPFSLAEVRETVARLLKLRS